MNEQNSIPISALQHLVFCPRQCALIHLERAWTENVLTAKGRLEHERTHKGFREFRRGKKQISGLRIQSKKLGIHGQLDLLEMEQTDPHGPDNLHSFNLKGTWHLYPVEFKHGKPKKNDCDRIQLCAQVLCLEEMLDILIDEASLFYQRIHRREDIAMNDALRTKTSKAIQDLHILFKNSVTPPPNYNSRCKSCSLKELCMPRRISVQSKYRQKLFTPQEII